MTCRRSSAVARCSVHPLRRLVTPAPVRTVSAASAASGPTQPAPTPSSACLSAERLSLGWGARREAKRSVMAAVAIVLAVVLAGCGVSAPVPSPSASAEVDLVAARRAAGIADCPQPAGEPVEGGLPELGLDCLGGDVTVALGALRGPTVINLWAQWCLPCRQEAPVLAAFDEARDDVNLLGINYDDPEPDWAIEFARRAEWTWPQLADPGKTVQGPLEIPGIPVSLLLDADGRIVARHHGAFDDLAQLTTWVDEGLA